MTNVQTVTLNFAPVAIQVAGNNSAELLENAKRAFVEQLTADTMPRVTSYSVGSADALNFETVYEGQIVESNDGKLGIVNQVNKKTIYVTYTDGATVSGSPGLFKTSEATFIEARNHRPKGDKELNLWSPGNTGYIKIKTGIKAVCVGKISRGKVKLLIVGTQKYISITEEQMERLLKDEQSEV